MFIVLVILGFVTPVVRQLVFDEASLPLYAATYVAVFLVLAVPLFLTGVLTFAWERVPD